MGVLSNVMFTSLKIRNVGKIPVNLKFIENREEKDLKNEDHKNCIKSNIVSKPIVVSSSKSKNKEVFQYCIYMKRENMKEWFDYNITILPDADINLTLFFGSGPDTRNKIEKNGNLILIFYTEKGTKCVAKWNEEKCKEWMKKQENS